MPSTAPARSGYARLAQADETEQYLDDDGDESPHQPQGPATIATYAPIQPGRVTAPDSRPPRRPGRWHRRSNSGVDIGAINARLERWADEIASKFKRRKGRASLDEQLEIHHSVFQAPDWLRPDTPDGVGTSSRDSATAPRITKIEFDDVVESVKVAIELGTHPKMISQGSSGSYFARDSEGKIVGVFKPKDEEPYASKNPKWTKWIHRNLFPFFFGRACLIPNLSYISEAAAYVLDARLQTNLVPYTDIVYLSSISFNYDYWDRRHYVRKRKALPAKVGSFQVFLKGYQDANLFLKQHPWPDNHQADRSLSSVDSNGPSWTDDCRPVGVSNSGKLPGRHDRTTVSGLHESSQGGTMWSPSLQQSFRGELEKLVILDYIMRNTDRGLDNWMIKIDRELQQASLIAEPPRLDVADETADPYPRAQPMSAVEHVRSTLGSKAQVGAIDNSLSWPWKHPDAWRSFPFGWLFLPVSLIGQPFSQGTRHHFLSLLTSKKWWSDTQAALRKCFIQDVDFQEKMFARQMAVMKGQAWNVVETLKTADHGPLELTRRTRVCVWDDQVDIPIVLSSKTQPVNGQADEIADSNQRQTMGDSRTNESYAPNHAVDRSIDALNHELSGSQQFTTTKPHDSTEVDNYGGAHTAGEPVAEARTAMQTRRRDISHRPGAKRSQTRLSYDEPRPYPFHHRKRNLSFTIQRIHDHDGEGDDNDGDLGYVAAQDMEANQKKVIVERLETVKSKSPVFTWC